MRSTPPYVMKFDVLYDFPQQESQTRASPDKCRFVYDAVLQTHVCIRACRKLWFRRICGQPSTQLEHFTGRHGPHDGNNIHSVDI